MLRLIATIILLLVIPLESHLIASENQTIIGQDGALSFANMRLGDDGVKAFLKEEAIKKYTSLDLSGNNLTDVSAYALIDHFKDRTFDEWPSINLSNNYISDVWQRILRNPKNQLISSSSEPNLFVSCGFLTICILGLLGNIILMSY